MIRTRVLVAIAAAASLAACGKKKSEGLPPAQEWSADQAMVAPDPTGSPHDPHVALGGGDPDDPHGGAVDMGGAGHAQPGPVDPNGPNPHAGMDMSAMMGGGGGDPANPHAGGGVDVSKMGLAAPDPNRKLDPSHHIKGVIKVHPKAKDHAKPGGAVFVIAKKADANGQPSGPPLAVEKLEWGSKDEIPFQLSDENQMVAGTELTGDVIVLVRYDQDSDALSKQPGDITGQAKLKIPADNVSVVLDTVLP